MPTDISLFISPDESFTQTDLLFGKYLGDKYFRFQCQVGFGAVWGVERGKVIYNEGLFGTTHYEKDPYFSFCLPVKMGFKVIPSRYVSVGLDIQTSANFINSQYMYLLSIEIGKLRNKIKK